MEKLQATGFSTAAVYSLQLAASSQQPLSIRIPHVRDTSAHSQFIHQAIPHLRFWLRVCNRTVNNTMTIISTNDIQGISKYVDSDAEVPKETLIQRMAGKVSYSLLVYIKSIIFHHAEKDNTGRIYLV
jgi:hypothetical protein